VDSQASQSTLLKDLFTDKPKGGIFQNHKSPDLQQAKIDSIQ